MGERGRAFSCRALQRSGRGTPAAATWRRHGGGGGKDGGSTAAHFEVLRLHGVHRVAESAAGQPQRGVRTIKSWIIRWIHALDHAPQQRLGQRQQRATGVVGAVAVRRLHPALSAAAGAGGMVVHILQSHRNRREQRRRRRGRCSLSREVPAST